MPNKLADAGARLCVVCGVSLEGRRRHARHCSGSCRAEASRLRRILSGEEADGHAFIDEYRGGPPRQQQAHESPEMIPPLRRYTTATRTARARRFVREHVIAHPDRRAKARQLYAAYVRWCEREEPDEPLTYAAFVGVLDDEAPFDDRIVAPLPPGRRGRGPLVFVGVELRA